MPQEGLLKLIPYLGSRTEKSGSCRETGAQEKTKVREDLNLVPASPQDNCPFWQVLASFNATLAKQHKSPARVTEAQGWSSVQGFVLPIFLDACRRGQRWPKLTLPCCVERPAPVNMGDNWEQGTASTGGESLSAL